MSLTDQRADGSPFQMRVRLKCADVQSFIESFATHVSKGGIFLASRTPQAVGTLIDPGAAVVDIVTREVVNQ